MNTMIIGAFAGCGKTYLYNEQHRAKFYYTILIVLLLCFTGSFLIEAVTEGPGIGSVTLLYDYSENSMPSHLELVLTNSGTGKSYTVELSADDVSATTLAVGSTTPDIPHGTYVSTLLVDGQLEDAGIPSEMTLGFLRDSYLVSITHTENGIGLTELKHSLSLGAELTAYLGGICCVVLVCACLLLKGTRSVPTSDKCSGEGGSVARRMRDLVVMLYEISMAFIPAVLFYIVFYGPENQFWFIYPVFLYLLPYCIHIGIFGDNARKYVDSIMGYGEP